ncbi:MAG: choice-of-anchor tandem repeat GloVer-containing protein [Candidatus Sulfotelmatobacter sp.]|jgi:uncharacterized repeat protein (TIGR03803 family)
MHLHRSNSSLILGACLAFAITMFTLSASAFGQTESILYVFTGGSDGSGPTGSLIFDGAGNLYGTTDAGGVDDGNGGKGVVYELTPATGGGWTETALYAFQGGTSDGEVPFGGVVFDAAGNLYGATNYGGAHDLGTVYELSPTGSGGWTERVIYSFAGGADGSYPNGGLVFDAAGNLYGTTVLGGAHNQGTIFELSPTGGGGWSESVILACSLASGERPTGSVVFDSAGNLYTTASVGGSSNAGTVLRLKFASGVWHAGVIHTFLSGSDGSEPLSGLTFQYPRLYGTTQTGGTYGAGTAFVLVPGSGGVWTKHVLHNFGAFDDGLYPSNPLTLNATGDIFGVTGSGGTLGNGMAFELERSGGTLTEINLHNFNTGSDAGGPAGGVVLDGAGNLYGAGHNGGSFGAGAVYEIVP